MGHQTHSSDTRSVTDTTLPTCTVERVIEYVAPFTLSNRETDNATVWAKLDAQISKV
jgi:hypothetical protein